MNVPELPPGPAVFTAEVADRSRCAAILGEVARLVSGGHLSDVGLLAIRARLRSTGEFAEVMPDETREVLYEVVKQIMRRRGIPAGSWPDPTEELVIPDSLEGLGD